VTNHLISLNTTTTINGKPVQVLGDFVSKSGGDGWVKTHLAYLEGLLTPKIVVVAQQDSWEDHYRLFEAIVVRRCLGSN